VRDPQATEVQVTMRYGVGAADDPIGKAGMAHLVEHLMHQQVLGTQSLFAQLESVAMSFDAFTSYEATTYVARAPADKLEKLLAMAAVRVGFRSPSITEQQFLREPDVAINEIRQRDLASDLLRAISVGLFEPRPPYRRIIGGSPASVGSITFAEACAFADARYATGNAALVVSGNINTEVLGTLLGMFMARIAARTFVPASPVPRMEHPDATIAVQVPIDGHALMFAWAIPTDPMLAIRARAIAPAVAAVIDGAVAGRVRATLLGDEHLPVFAVFVELGEQAPDTVKAKVRDRGAWAAIASRARLARSTPRRRSTRAASIARGSRRSRRARSPTWVRAISR
jgi:predicted Zn-dependent peptidase